MRIVCRSFSYPHICLVSLSFVRRINIEVLWDLSKAETQVPALVFYRKWDDFGI